MTSKFGQFDWKMCFIQSNLQFLSQKWPKFEVKSHFFHKFVWFWLQIKHSEFFYFAFTILFVWDNEMSKRILFTGMHTLKWIAFVSTDFNGFHRHFHFVFFYFLNLSNTYKNICAPHSRDVHCWSTLIFNTLYFFCLLACLL